MRFRTPPENANYRRLALVAIALIALGGCSAGPPQVLRVPAPQVGQASRTETRITLNNGKLVLHAGGERIAGSCALTLSSIEEDEILEVKGRQVTKMQTSVVSDDSTETIEIAREKDRHLEKGPLAGEIIVRELLDGKWKNTLVGMAPTPKQQKELDSLPPLDNLDDLLPEGPVSPGYTWKLDTARLRKFLGVACTDLTGEARMTFVKTTTLDGESCLLINVTLDVKGKMRDDADNEMAIEMNGKGTTYQSLKTGHDLKMSLTGAMKLTGVVVNDGQRVQQEMSGPFTLEGSTKPNR